MPIQQRTPYKPSGPGPYLAIVRNHLDPSYMGSLEVVLVKNYVGDIFSSENEGIIVRYLSPFFGSTSIAYQGKDYRKFDDVQKSYGMWMVPPDVGTTVMVIFVDGDYNQGYWIGCVPDRFQNRMVPGIAADNVATTSLTSDQIKKYGTGVNYLPVAESLKVSDDNTQRPTSGSAFPPPVHPFADRLAAQGLLRDRIRGVTSSSARRETPSSVFGISTPGPIDPKGKTANIRYDGQAISKRVSRLGGSTFVMDDGDVNGNNELVRIRTRTGHQILLHDTSKLIYIANGEGTAWIEMTESGKIDIYAADSVSIHTEADFNFRANRDVNIEAGNDINLHAFGNINTESKKDINVRAKNNSNIFAGKNISVYAAERIDLETKDVYLAASGGLNLIGNTIKISAIDSLDLYGGNELRDFAKTIKNKSKDTKVAEAASITVPPAFSIGAVPQNVSSVGWSGNRSFSAGTLNSMLQRVPMHEPWSQHDTAIPGGFSLNSTYKGSGLNPPAKLTDSASSDITEVKKDIPSALGQAMDIGAIYFGSGSGDQDHFTATSEQLQAAIIAASIEYKKQSGSGVIITSGKRSKEEQQALYDTWIAAGGGPNNPNAGGLYIPVDPNGNSWPTAHGLGLAVDIDSKIADDLDRRGILSSYGLIRPFPNDPVHVQLGGKPNE
jgi:hypothetical protein